MKYTDFILKKTQSGYQEGFDPVFMPDCMFDFQKHLTEWAIKKGRAAIFADCGLGKTLMQLVWAENIVRKTGGRVLILTPLAVASQTSKEADKFGISAEQSKEGDLYPITITNYERLHYFKPDDFIAVVCDESSILKNFQGETKKAIIRFMLKMPYRLLCTATASPNDYIELGNSSEALGELSYSEMLKRFFRQLDNKGQEKENKKQKEAERLISRDNNYYRKLSFRVSQTIGQWRLKNHAVESFWRWVCSWARACRMPSDLGFKDDDFVLPELIKQDHIIKINTPPEGKLFYVPAIGLCEEREERKKTLVERCEYVKNLVNHDDPAVIWCHANAEGDYLEKIIEGSRQVAGKTPDEDKIKIYDDFQKGEIRVVIIKPKIGAWGLNWQHCNHVVTFATHSYEQFYQSVRRCWRFGQKKPVRLDVVSTEGETRVIENMNRKSKNADEMFTALVKEMNKSMKIERCNIYTEKERVPSWVL